MVKFKVVAIFTIILLANLVNAIEVVDMPGNGLSDEIKQAQTMVKTVAGINAKIDESTTIVSQNMKTLDENFKLRMQEFYTSLVVIQVLINLATLGLGYGVYFYFKSRRLI